MPTQPRTWVVHVGLFAVVASWAVNQNLTKEIFFHVSPLAYVFVRFCGLLLLALILLRSTRRTPWTRQELLLTACAGLGGYFLNQIGFTLGISRTTVFSTSLLVATSPIFTVLALAAGRLERVHPRQWAGIFLAFGGIALFLSEGARFGLATGDLLSLLAGFAFAAFNIFNKPLLQRHDPSEVMASNLVCGGIPLLGVGLPFALRQSWTLPWSTWGLIGYTIVVPIFLSYIVWNWGLRRVGVARTAPYAYLTPVLAGVLSSILFGESFGLVKVLGAAACLAGLVLTAARQPAAATKQAPA